MVHVALTPQVISHSERAVADVVRRHTTEHRLLDELGGGAWSGIDSGIPARWRQSNRLLQMRRNTISEMWEHDTLDAKEGGMIFGRVDDERSV